MRKRTSFFIFLFLSSLILFSFFSGCLFKPPVTEGVLKGQVIVPEGSVQEKDLTGQALPNATVNIIDPATGAIIATATTDANGYYQVFVPAGGPYILEAVKDGVKLQQVTPQVEVGIEYDLGTADCSTTSVALIAQAMLVAEDYPDDLADINLADITVNPNFNDVMNPVCSTIEAGGDPAELAVIQQAVEDFLYPPPPTPAPIPEPAPTPLTAIAAISGTAKVGEILTAGALTPAGATANYQWQICATSDGTYTNISGAISTTYTPVAGDVTKFIKVAATGTGNYSGTVTSTATTAVTAAVINIAAIPGVTAPVTGANPVDTITATAQYTGTITWAPTDDPFLGEKIYTATITLTAKAGFTLTGVAANFFTVADATTVTNAVDSGEVTAVFPATAAAVIDIDAIPGVTVPETGATPVTVITETAQYTGTVTWSPDDSTFGGTKAYTATITLTVKPGFTLTGVAENFFTIEGATTDTNPADSGVVTAVFPATATVAIGESCGGGIVAYILQSGDAGYVAGEQHGLIAATADSAASTMACTNITGTLIGTTGTAMGTGRANTTAIVGQAGCDSGAAYYCDTLDEGGHNDWFLPSKDELNKLYDNRAVIDNFVVDWYWSSSEYDKDHVWAQHFGTALDQQYKLKDYSSSTPIYFLNVRAVRAF
jgi:hypothetical protein